MEDNLNDFINVNTGEEEKIDIDFYKLYLAELEAIKPCTKEEELLLLEQVLKGDKGAKKRLSEGKLKMAAALAEEYKNQGISMSDLVQEANMALLLFLEEYCEGDFNALLEARIREALSDAVEFQSTESQVEEELLARVNVLKDISSNMARELGREATVEELAERMKMTEEEIKDIMKLTLDALSVSGT